MTKPLEVSESKKLKALSHPLRQKIMVAIRAYGLQSAISPKDLAERFDMTLSKVSYHIRVLVDVEVIYLAETKPVRGSLQHFYYPDREFIALPWVSAFLDAADSKAEGNER